VERTPGGRDVGLLGGGGAQVVCMWDKFISNEIRPKIKKK
jgi:hypothetical protein